MARLVGLLVPVPFGQVPLSRPRAFMRPLGGPIRQVVLTILVKIREMHSTRPTASTGARVLQRQGTVALSSCQKRGSHIISDQSKHGMLHQ